VGSQGSVVPASSGSPVTRRNEDGVKRRAPEALVVPVAQLRVGASVSRTSSLGAATSIDGSGPPRSPAARRRAATSRSSESMVSMSRMQKTGNA
jgi:hypothetical protein